MKQVFDPHSVRKTIIKLDWDDISFQKAMTRIGIIMDDSNVRYIYVYSSPRGRGYHLYVHLKNPRGVIRKRFEWFDDRKRLDADLTKKSIDSFDVLWNVKHTPTGTYYRTILFGIDPYPGPTPP